MLCCLWLKLYRDYDVQQSCVGGADKEGNSTVNELSYLMLDVTEALGFVRCLSVRYSPRTEKAFVQRALEVVGHVQKGIRFSLMMMLWCLRWSVTASVWRTPEIIRR